MGLDVSFQYRLMKDKLPDLYRMTLTEYNDNYVRIARDMILKTGGSYNASDYWKQRKVIADKMLENLRAELQKNFA